MTKTITWAEEDVRLTIAIREGDKQALGRVYDKYAPILLGLVSRIIPVASCAEEILQTTFLHIWHQIGSFNASGSSLFTWLMNTARQLAFDKVRLGQVENLTQHNLVYPKPNSNDTGHIIPEPVEKIIFDRVYYKGESCILAAEALGMPVQVIKKHIGLAIKNMISVKVL